MAAGQIRTSENPLMALGRHFVKRMCPVIFFVFFLHGVKKVYLLMCLLSSRGVSNVSTLLAYNKNGLCFHNVLCCCYCAVPDGTVAGVSHVQPSLGWWWSVVPQLPPCTALPAWERGGEVALGWQSEQH